VLLEQEELNISPALAVYAVANNFNVCDVPPMIDVLIDNYIDLEEDSQND
jgi:hypothetical protein